MTVHTEHDAETNTYSLGDDIGGVFVPFATIDGPAVQARIAAANAAAELPAAAPNAATATVADGTGAAFNAADFTDNGDGTFTRNADNVQGRFTPSGFEPVTTP